MTDFENIKTYIKEGIEDTNNPSFNLITGSAGSGKTTLLKKFNQAFKKSSIVAPTGVAALNCGGITIHSFLKIGTKGNLKKLALGKNVTGEYKKVFEKLDLLIIDEISFVSAPLLDGLSSSLKKIRKNKTEFGGVSILCSGDLFQLPPVITEKKELKDLGYKSKYFFHSNVFKEIVKKDALNYFHLPININYRQRSDKKYLKLLNKIRQMTDINEVIQEFNQHCLNNKTANPTVLSPWKKNVHKENQTKLNALKGSIVNFSAKNRTGQFLYKTKDDKLPAAPELKLKVGAKVVMVKNDKNYHKRWVNGSTGVVTDISEKDVIKIKIDGYNRNVAREKWEHYKNEYDEKKEQIIQKHDGFYEQFPIALGWAFTIHKSQSLTLENVELDMTGGRAFQHGMIYVALSRCKKLKDMSFRREITREDFIFDKEALKFQEYLNDIPNLINNSKHEHQDYEDTHKVKNVNEKVGQEIVNDPLIKSRLEKIELEIKNLKERVHLLESGNPLHIKQEKEKKSNPRPLKITNEELFQLLRKKRAEIAKEDDVSHNFIIASDKTLNELAEVRPETTEELSKIHGLAEVRIAKYGQRFLNTILSARKD